MFPVPPLRKIMSVWIVPCGVEISRGNSVAPRDVLGLLTPLTGGRQTNWSFGTLSNR